MKKTILLLLTLFLSACASNQNANTDTLGTNSATTNQQIINDTNYQNMIREQSNRMQAVETEVPHVGGRR